MENNEVKKLVKKLALKLTRKWHDKHKSDD